MDCWNFSINYLLQIKDIPYQESNFIFSEVFEWVSLLSKIGIVLLDYYKEVNIIHEHEEIFINLAEDEIPLRDEYIKWLDDFQKKWWKYSNREINLDFLEENLKDNYCIIYSGGCRELMPHWFSKYLKIIWKFRRNIVSLPQDIKEVWSSRRFHGRSVGTWDWGTCPAFRMKTAWSLTMTVGGKWPSHGIRWATSMMKKRCSQLSDWYTATMLRYSSGWTSH